MTDEEIEKVVARCRKENCTGCSFYNLSGCLAVVDYIKRLKAEIASLTGALKALTVKENFERTLEKANEELKERTDKELKAVREETAKEILQEFSELCNGQGGVCYDSDIKAIAEKFGVEVEE